MRSRSRGQIVLAWSNERESGKDFIGGAGGGARGKAVPDLESIGFWEAETG